MKILIAVGNDLSRPRGSSTHVQEIAANLQRRGHTIYLFGYRLPGNSAGFGGMPLRVPLPRIPIVRGVWFNVSSFFYLLYRIKGFNIDLVYTRLSSKYMIPAIVAHITGRPLVVEVNGFVKDELSLAGYSPLRISYATLIERLSYSWAAKIITVTEGLKEALVEAYAIPPSKITVISNGVDTELYSPEVTTVARERLRLSESDHILLFVGYLEKWQGLDTLLDCLPVVLAEYPQLKLMLVGEGPQDAKLRLKAGKLRIQSAVRFVGAVPQTQVPDYINAADICVAPFSMERNSRIGLSPLKLYAYMACAKPVVASDIQGVGSVLAISSAGIAVEPDNPQALSKAIIHLLSNESLREELGMRGRQLVVQKYRWEDVAERIEKELDAILQA